VCLRRAGLIDAWPDGMIEAGGDMQAAISEYVKAADIIVLLLLSSDFLASEKDRPRPLWGQAGIDEETAENEIAGLCEGTAPTRGPGADEEGKGLWLKQKPR